MGSAATRSGGAHMSRPLLMALHSSSETFGVAVQDPLKPEGGRKVAVFDDGRSLSNTLIARVSTLLPPERWSDLEGLAVATGPGGFTGTRLSVVMARTLAQQLNCRLIGVSSYALMASRLVERLPLEQKRSPFWIQRELPRRGWIAGCYQLLDGRIEEIRSPHLLPPGQLVEPVLAAKEDVAADVERLLALLQLADRLDTAGPWQPVLPLYPTSPVGPV